MRRPKKRAISSNMSATGRRRLAEANQTRWASDHDFNMRRAVITALYNTNNATLPRIMETMERQYGFYAT
jgi:hypothetical protein